MDGSVFLTKLVADMVERSRLLCRVYGQKEWEETLDARVRVDFVATMATVAQNWPPREASEG